ncbi:hypothetical protein [Streptomyces sp. x-80]|uniref:hypothetical protein n=1 Tax=Streptomyces sp. x-80 TaxID=2789282 RepID=UPI0039805193
MRIEVPPGTTLAELTREEHEGRASELDFCSRNREYGNVCCGTSNWRLLRVRTGRRAEGAEGRGSVPEPLKGDTKPADNSAPIKVEITGTAPPGEAVPPVPAGRGSAASSGASTAAGTGHRRILVLTGAAAAAPSPSPSRRSSSPAAGAHGTHRSPAAR